MKPPNAVLYLRVSTKEQVDNTSLKTQEEQGRRFAEHNSLKVYRIFREEGESAKTTARTALQKMIKFCIEHKPDVSAVVIWRYDRLARQLEDQIDLVKRFGLLGIKVLSVTENNEDSAEGTLMRNIIGSFSQYENDVRSLRTRTGMQKAIREGRWVHRPPLGYTMVRDTAGKPLMVPTEDRRYVSMIYEMFLSGYTQADIIRALRANGRPIDKNRINGILRHPIYAGLLRDWDTNELVKALHEAIVSEHDYHRVQAVLAGKSYRSVPHCRQNEKYPLRGSLRCPECGKKLTASASKGGAGGRYEYYHCAKKAHTRLKAEETHEAFREQLLALEPNQGEIKLFGAILRDAWKARSGDLEKQRAELLKQKAEVEATRGKAEDLFIKGKISEETFNRKKEEYAEGLQTIEIELEHLVEDYGDVEACVSYAMRVLYDLSGFWERGNLTAKQRLQDIVFPEGLVFEESGFRTPRTSSLFRGLQAVKAPPGTFGSP